MEAGSETVKHILCSALVFLLLTGFVSFASHVAPPPNTVLSVAFSPDGKKVITGTWGGTVRIWDAGSGKELQRFVHAD